MITCLTITGEKYKQFENGCARCLDAQTLEHYELIYRDSLGPVGSVGGLRNAALKAMPPDTDYIAHFDVDDISAPNRLAVQLAHIQKTGKEVTGFYSMPMYDSKNDKVWLYENPHKEHYSLGNCLFYKREAWERVKFPDTTPEDNTWRKNIGGENIETRSVWEDGKPLMIQVVHGGNASASIIRSSTYYKEPSEAQEKAIRELLASA